LLIILWIPNQTWGDIIKPETYHDKKKKTKSFSSFFLVLIQLEFSEKSDGKIFITKFAIPNLQSELSLFASGLW